MKTRVTAFNLHAYPNSHTISRLPLFDPVSSLVNCHGDINSERDCRLEISSHHKHATKLSRRHTTHDFMTSELALPCPCHVLYHHVTSPVISPLNALSAVLQIISAVVEVTTAHRGYMEFRICGLSQQQAEATQPCLNRYESERDDVQDETR